MKVFVDILLPILLWPFAAVLIALLAALCIIFWPVMGTLLINEARDDADIG